MRVRSRRTAPSRFFCALWSHAVSSQLGGTLSFFFFFTLVALSTTGQCKAGLERKLKEKTLFNETKKDAIVHVVLERRVVKFYFCIESWSILVVFGV